MVIVAHRGHEFPVGRQRDGRIRPAVIAVTAKELRGHVGRIGGAAAVAADQQLVTGGEAPDDQAHSPVERFLHRTQRASRGD